MWQAGPGGLDEREQRVAVAVEAQRLDRWMLPDVAPLCHSSSRERLQRCSSPVSRVRAQRLGVHVGERQHLARAPVLDDARDEAALVEGDWIVHGRGILGGLGAPRTARRVRLVQVPAERAVGTARCAAHDARSSAVSARGGSAGIRRWRRSARRNAGAWRVAERARSARSASLAAALAGEHRAQLAARGDAEVERGADALAREREAVAGAVADEEHAVLGGRAQRGAGTSCPGSGRRRRRGAAASVHGRLLDVVARLVGADADRAASPPAGTRQRVAAADERAVDPDVEVARRRASCGWTSSPRESGASGGW